MPVASMPPIAGSRAQLTAQQTELIDLAARLGRERFAPRAARWDREASFPLDNFKDLHETGLLAICVPEAHGGLGADFATYALVAAELGRHCGSTALSFNMHVCATLWSGLIADGVDMSAAQRRDHQRIRAIHYERVTAQGQVYSQPFSEGGAATAGKAPWRTHALRVAGGYRVSGKKIFASLSGAADYYGVLCTLDTAAPGGGTLGDALYLAIPAGAGGVTVCGDWDPMGMRGTVSRTLLLDDVFVPDEARLMPEGLYFQATQRFPYIFTTLSPTYLGIAQAAYDFTVAYLRGEVAGVAAVKRRMYPTKQLAVAEMRVRLEQTRALFLQTVREARFDPDDDARMRLLAMHYAVMENANQICSLALRTCGGQALLKSLPLERLYRDSRCGSLMLPWTAELCADRLGRESLYEAGESDEVIDS